MPAFSAFKSFAAEKFELHPGTGKLLPMEGMRGLSAFLVFFVHFYALFESHAAASPTVHAIFSFLATIGHCGVDIFFALSGFIIYGLLQKRPVKYLDYMHRRVVRLYPVFTAIFLLYLVASLVVPAYSKLPSSFFPAVRYLAANYFLLPGIFPIAPMITPAWSLSYELFFYITIPLLVRWLRIFQWPRSARLAFFLVLCASHLTLLKMGLSLNPRMIMFGAGILVYETWRIRPSWTRFGDLPAVIAFVATLGLVGTRSLPLVEAYCGPTLSNSYLIMVCLFASTYGLGYFALGGDGWLSKAFSWTWLRWFGNISYSYYLTHGAILQLVKFLMELIHLPALLSPFSFVMLWIFSFAATVVGSSVVFLTIEKRFSFHTRPAQASQPIRQETVAAG